MSNVLDIMIYSAKLSSSPFNYSSGHFLAFSYIRYIEIFVICCNAGFFISFKYFKSWRFRQVLKASSQTNCRKRLCLSSFQKDKSRKHKTKSSQNNSLVPLYQSTYKVSSKESIWFNLFCWVCHILLFCSSLGCYSYLVENLRQLYRRQMKYCPLSFALIIFSPSLDVECQIFITLLWSPSYICLHIFWWKSVT